MGYEPYRTNKLIAGKLASICSISRGQRSTGAIVSSAGIPLWCNQNRIGRRGRHTKNDVMAAPRKRADQVRRKSALDHDLVRYPLIMHTRLADCLRDRQLAVDHIEDHLQHRGDDAAAARRAGNEKWTAVLQQNGWSH